jgi:hypothetical protein
MIIMKLINFQIKNIKNIRTIITLIIGLLSLSIYTQAQNAFTAGAAVFSSQDQVKTADIDGDNDQDIITISGTGITLYLNDGSGNFTAADNSTIGLPVGTGSFFLWQGPTFGVGNVIGNSALDILIVSHGINLSGDKGFAELYQNDGSGNFTLVNGTPFNEVGDGTVGIEDIDGNGHNDIVIFGDDLASIGVSGGFDPFGLFWNDGAGNFTVGPDLISAKTPKGDIVFGDIDGDTDIDLFLGGGIEVTPKIYKNDGDQTFTQVISFSGNNNLRASFFDADNDNDLDLIFAHDLGDSLFINDGTGNFTLDNNNSFAPTSDYGLATGDIDGDGDNDIYIKGTAGVNNYVGGFYINDGSGRFYLDNTISLPNSTSGYTMLTDITGDNKLDLISTSLSNVYTNAFPGFGKAVDFDGTNTYIAAHLAAINSLPITFEFWTNTTDNTVGIYDKRGANISDYLEIRVLGGRYGFNYNNSSGGTIDVTSTNTINDGQWHHCAITLNTTECKMYVDSVLDKTVNWTGTAGAVSNTLDVTFGDFSGSKYTGILDEFRIWNTVRTQPEIANNMCTTISNPASEANLIANYSFDQYVNNATYFDNSSSHNHMTISASTITTTSEQTGCTPAAPLPVELTYFKGQSISNGNLLTWQTATEKNNEGFHIERRANGSDWTTIGFIHGNGSTNEVSNYEFVDNGNLRGFENLLGLNLYYRLKQIDYDGNFEYSNIIQLATRNSQPVTARISPNPATDHFTIETNEPMSIQIINAQGQIIKEYNVENGQQINIKDLPSGIYYVSMLSNGSRTVQKLIKR